MSEPPPDLPEGIDPVGVPRPGGDRDTFVMVVAVVVALLALIVTLGWIVYHHLVVMSALASWGVVNQPL